MLVVPLIINAWPVRLKGEEKEIYEAYFKSKLSKKQFKILISKARRKEVDISNTQLIQQGNQFDELIFLYQIPESKIVRIYFHDRAVHQSEEGDFLGMLETTFFMKKERVKKIEVENNKKKKKDALYKYNRMQSYVDDKQRWDISVKIETNGAETTDPVVYYRWERADLVNILYNKEYGKRILNALYSMWLEKTIHMLTATFKRVEDIYQKKETKTFDLRQNDRELQDGLRGSDSLQSEGNGLRQLSGIPVHSNPF